MARYETNAVDFLFGLSRTYWLIAEIEIELEHGVARAANSQDNFDMSAP
jgi:hypothetical protein